MRLLIASSWVVAACGAFLSGCMTTPPDEDPVQIKLNDLDARLTRIERIVTNQSLVELAQHLDEVQSSVRQLRGRMDQLENNNEAMRKQQRDLYNDLEKKLGALQGAPPPAGNYTGGTSVVPPAVPPSAAPTAANPGAATPPGSAVPPGPQAPAPAGTSSVEQAVYNQAFDALKASSYSIAITGFRDFLSTYPASPLAENAQYWIGEAYYVTRDFGNASTAFRTVLDRWPSSRKAPDAMLKLGYTQFELKRYGDARATLTEVTQKFPNTDAAKLATDRLARIPANSR